MNKTDYLIATKNMKKREELQRILSPLGIQVRLAEELGLDLTDVEETGTTFEENALLKAKSGCAESGLPCIADDSGLAVDALNGEPGVYSARYAGEHGNDGLNNETLLANLQHVSLNQRSARFVCAACCVYPDGRAYTVRGECEGHIGFEPKGAGGFGYDCIFSPADDTVDNIAGKTMAQIDDKEKDKISHRGKALRLLAQRIGGAI
jgi:XTP/dITP diphosphohydrolase